MQTLAQDLRLALRSLHRERLVTLVAAGSLAIGIAANATVFSLIQALEFPRLIYPEASRIIFLETMHQPRQLVGMPVSAPDALDIVQSTRTFERWTLTADHAHPRAPRAAE